MACNWCVSLDIGSLNTWGGRERCGDENRPKGRWFLAVRPRFVQLGRAAATRTDAVRGWEPRRVVQGSFEEIVVVR